MPTSQAPPIPSQNTFDLYTKLANTPLQPRDAGYQNALVSAANYQLQTQRADFAKRWGWSTQNAAQQKVLNLIAIPAAGYSTSQERLSTPGIQHVLKTIAYLFKSRQGQHLPQGIERHRPKIDAGGNVVRTFCNIFVNDVTRLLYCEIPNHPLDGYRHVRSMVYWLEEPSCGIAAGWRTTASSVEAQNWATDGFVAIVVHLRSDGGWSDHIAIVRPLEAHVAPPPSSGYFYPRIAQAGQIVSDDLDSGNARSFGSYPTNEIIYFLHD